MTPKLALLWWWLVAIVFVTNARAKKRPHIIVIVADDLVSVKAKVLFAKQPLEYKKFLVCDCLRVPKAIRISYHFTGMLVMTNM